MFVKKTNAILISYEVACKNNDETDITTAVPSAFLTLVVRDILLGLGVAALHRVFAPLLRALQLPVVRQSVANPVTVEVYCSRSA